jgi:hypoxanthine phosphoribosyltransferase
MLENTVHKDIEKILIDENTISLRVKALAAEISAYYSSLGVEEIVLLGILRGAVVFFSDLARHIIQIPLVFDFMALSSYGDASVSSGEVKIIKDASENLSGRHVLIVEDIIDSGITLNALNKLLRSRNCASIRLCAFCDKPSRRKVPVNIDFCAFTVPDEFIVGYGMDYGGFYRQLPYVGALKV